MLSRGRGEAQGGERHREGGEAQGGRGGDDREGRIERGRDGMAGSEG